jgi:hypothetical protein
MKKLCAGLLAAVIIAAPGPLAAQHEHDLHFGIVDGRMAVAEPDTFEVPKVLYFDGENYLRDQGMDGVLVFLPGGGSYWQLKSFTWRQISITPGLSIGNWFGVGKPGYVNLDDGPNRHLHRLVTARQPGTYVFTSYLHSGIDHRGNPVPDSEPFTMIWVTARNNNNDIPAYASVDLPLLRNLPDTPLFPLENGWAGVELNGLVVSAVFPSGFYAQTAGRTGGVFVQGGSGVVPGDRVTVRGWLATRGSERVVVANEPVEKTASGPAPGALTLRCSAVGGGRMGKYTPGTAGGAGLSNTGLLIRVAGILRSEAGRFYVDDGSPAVNDAASAKGLKVSTELLGSPLVFPPAGTLVVLTGVSGTEESSAGIIPVIRLRSQSDIAIP